MSYDYQGEKIDDKDIGAAIKIVDEHRRKLKLQEQERALAEEIRRQIGYDFDTTEGRSIGHTAIRYNKKKKKNPNTLRNAIYIAVLSVAILVGAGLDNVITNATNVTIPRTMSNRFEVDERIDYYKSWMGMNSESQHKVEICYGHDANGEAIVDYSPENLAYHIINAASKSESEVRAVILAAYNIINEPYRAQVLDNTFWQLAQRVQEDSSINLDGYLITGSSEDFLEILGYEDWDDYKMNERKNIRDLRLIENYINKGETK